MNIANLKAPSMRIRGVLSAIVLLGCIVASGDGASMVADTLRIAGENPSQSQRHFGDESGNRSITKYFVDGPNTGNRRAGWSRKSTAGPTARTQLAKLLNQSSTNTTRVTTPIPRARIFIIPAEFATSVRPRSAQAKSARGSIGSRRDPLRQDSFVSEIRVTRWRVAAADADFHVIHYSRQEEASEWERQPFLDTPSA